MARTNRTTETDTPRTTAKNDRPTRVRGGGLAWLLVLGGLALVAGGAALCLADRFSWQVVRVRRMLETFGVSGAPVALTGVTVLAAGMAARAALRGSRSLVAGQGGGAQGERLELVTGQLATDLASVRQAMGRLGEGMNQLAGAQNQLGTQLAELGATDPGKDQREGLFRLAASMDKLAAQIDERFVALERELGERFERVAVVLESGGGPSAMSGGGASVFEHEAAAPPRAGGLVYVDEHPGATQEELDVLVELERELLDGKEPNLEFFDAVEDFDASASSELGTKSVQLNLETPPARGPRKPLDIVRPDEKKR